MTRAYMKPAAHGTRSKYTRGCRCDICSQANREYHRIKRGMRRRDSDRQPTKHNAATYRNWGCRCDVCRDAHNASLRAYRAKQRAS